MKISYNWLQSYFSDKVPAPEKLAEVLTLRSFEVEGHLEVNLPSGEKDTIFEIDVLPNRSHDCLSHIGLAREVAVLISKPLIQRPDLEGSQRSDLGQTENDLLALEVTDEKLVPRATKQVIVDVEVKESPAWLKERLAAMGQKPINNIVDATNFVMFETGQPVHAFDYESIA